jgi:SNF2 family DNA or RNA helicase
LKHIMTSLFSLPIFLSFCLSLSISSLFSFVSSLRLTLLLSPLPGKSYAQACWVNEPELERQGFRRRLLQYLDRRPLDVTHLPHVTLDTFFPQEYLEPDRVIAMQRKPGGQEEFLVKWRALPYSEATWETQASLASDEKIRDFQRHQVPPPPRAESEAVPAARVFKPLDDTLTFRSDNKLRAYQLEGLNWLLFCWHQRRGCVLADEMGLGKTIQAVSFCQQLHTQYGLGPFLVVAPLSTLQHWYREFTSWTHLNAVVYHGSAADRAIIRQ